MTVTYRFLELRQAETGERVLFGLDHIALIQNAGAGRMQVFTGDNDDPGLEVKGEVNELSARLAKIGLVLELPDGE